MKKIVTQFILLFFFQVAFAQYYYLPFPDIGQNPGNLNNDLEVSLTGMAPGWTTILGASNATPAWCPAQTIPFNFLFDGSPVTQYIVSSSGILSFDVFTALPAPSYTKAALPDASIPDFSVCIWGLVGKGFNDYISSKTFGTSPNRQHWIHFSSYGYGTNISDASNSTFWSIVLEETTNNIYIVDSRTIGYTGFNYVSAGIQMDALTAYSIEDSPNLLSLASTGATAKDNTFYTFIQGTQPAIDAAIDKINTSIYLSFGSNSIKGIVKNYGTDTITSLKLNYSINGGAIVSDVLTGISIPKFETLTFTQNTPWICSIPGAYTIQSYATEINGAIQDQNNANDSLSKVVNILLYFEQRIPLFEIFTSSTCGPCKPGNINYHNIVDTISPEKYVSIKYQQDFPGSGDPYTTDESTNRRANYYDIFAIPHMEIDGGWDGNANFFNYGLYEDARAIPASYSMNGSYSTDTINKTYSAKVRYSPLFNSVGAKLNVAIVENTTTQNIKTNGETKFYDVMKKMLPDENGTTLATIPEGTWDSTTFIYTFNGNYRLPLNGQTTNIIDNSIENSVEQFSDLKILGWIQASDGSKVMLQSSNFTKETQIGIYSLNKSVSSISIYPNPAKDYTAVEMVLTAPEKLTIKLMDAAGRMLELKQFDAQSGLTKTQFDVSKLTNGFYHITVTDSKNNSFTRRIAVVK